MKHPEDSFY